MRNDRRRASGVLRRLTALVLAAVMLCLSAGCARREAHDYYVAGAEAMAQGDFETAGSLFQKTVETGEFLPDAYRGLGLSYMCRNNYADACVALERARLYGESKDAAFVRDTALYLAYCRACHNETDKALDIYTSMLTQEEDAEVYFLRGRLLFKSGDEEGAAADFDKAASLSHDDSLFISIYQLYHERQKDADGAAYLRQGLAMAEQDADAYIGRALVYYYLQNYREAKAQLTAGLEKNPSDREALLLLGKVYLAMDDVTDARAMFTAHLKDDDLMAAAYDGLALCDMAEGSYQTALAYIQKGLSLNDETTRRSLLFNEIVAYEYLNDWETARARAASYIAAYPADENGLRENEFLSTR